MKNSEAPGVANAHESGESKGVAAVAVGSALPRDVVERAERYTDTFCSLTDNTCGEVSTRFHAAVLLHELRSIRRYCGALEDQLDEFGLKSAQRAAGLDEPNAGGVPRPESALMPKHSTPEKL